MKISSDWSKVGWYINAVEKRIVGYVGIDCDVRCTRLIKVRLRALGHRLETCRAGNTRPMLTTYLAQWLPRSSVLVDSGTGGLRPPWASPAHRSCLPPCRGGGLASALVLGFGLRLRYRVWSSLSISTCRFLSLCSRDYTACSFFLYCSQ